jgi:flagellar biosynthesis protein FlhB
VGGFLVFAMSEAQDRLLAGMITHPMAFTSVIRDIGVEIVITIAAVMVVIAAADLLLVALSLARGTPHDAPGGQGRDQAE